jgi:hypothetical protein
VLLPSIDVGSYEAHNKDNWCRTQWKIYSFFLSSLFLFYLVFSSSSSFLLSSRIINFLPPTFFLSFCVLVIVTHFTFCPLLFSKYPFLFCSLFAPSAISIMTLHLHMIPILQALFHVEHPFTNATYFFHPSRFPCYKVVHSNSN